MSKFKEFTINHSYMESKIVLFLATSFINILLIKCSLKKIETTHVYTSIVLAGLEQLDFAVLQIV